MQRLEIKWNCQTLSHLSRSVMKDNSRNKSKQSVLMRKVLSVKVGSADIWE